MNEITKANEITMSSREIAELVQSRHDNVKVTVERLVERGVIASPAMQEKPTLGRPVTEYLIGKRDSFIVVAQLSPEFTARLVDRWQELESRAARAVDLNDPTALRSALLGYTEKVLALQDQIAEQAPAVEFAHGIRNSADAISIGDFAKVLGTGRNRFFDMLRGDHLLMADNKPYQQFIDRGYFRVIETSWTDGAGNVHPTFKTLITGAGQVYLQRKYGALAGCAA